MQTPIGELEDLSLTCDSVSMGVMDTRAFEVFFGRIYGAVNRFRSRPHTDHESAQLVGVACQLLEAAVNHHRSPSAAVTESAVKVYDEIVRLLLHIMGTDFGVNESSYKKARDTKLKLDALKACGITPPGHSENRFSRRIEGGESGGPQETEALRFAQENVVEFTRFVFNLGHTSEYIPDPFWGGQLSTTWPLYERVKSLIPIASMIELQRGSGDA